MWDHVGAQGANGQNTPAFRGPGSSPRAHPHWPQWVAVGGLVQDGVALAVAKARDVLAGGGGGGSLRAPLATEEVRSKHPQGWPSISSWWSSLNGNPNISLLDWRLRAGQSSGPTP